MSKNPCQHTGVCDRCSLKVLLRVQSFKKNRKHLDTASLFAVFLKQPMKRFRLTNLQQVQQPSSLYLIKVSILMA